MEKVYHLTLQSAINSTNGRFEKALREAVSLAISNMTDEQLKGALFFDRQTNADKSKKTA